MKIIEIISSPKPTMSFEIFPPKRLAPQDAEKERADIVRTQEVVRRIAAERPAFISVTYGAAGGTTGANTGCLADFVQRECGVTALAHLTCIMSSRDRIADEIKSFREKGIENILCLRGDYPPDFDSASLTSRSFFHAVDLVKVLRPSNFCLGGACYPEGHPESAGLDQDIAYLRKKVEAGLDFLTTQMFFDNSIYFHYLARLRTACVTIPVIPGIMPVVNGRQIDRICKLSGTRLPPRFRAIVDRFGDDPVAMTDAGVAYATEQIADLFAQGVNHVHVYTMNRPEIASRLLRNLHGIVVRG